MTATFHVGDRCTDPAHADCGVLVEIGEDGSHIHENEDGRCWHEPEDVWVRQ